MPDGTLVIESNYPDGTLVLNAVPDDGTVLGPDGRTPLGRLPDSASSAAEGGLDVGSAGRLYVPGGGNPSGSSDGQAAYCYPGVPAHSGRYSTEPVVVVTPPFIGLSDAPGWEASAFSAEALVDDGYARFQIPASQGVVVGFSLAGWESSDYTTIALGIYAYTATPQLFFYPISYGQFIGLPIEYNANDYFFVERRQHALRVYHSTTDTFDFNAPLHTLELN